MTESESKMFYVAISVVLFIAVLFISEVFTDSGQNAVKTAIVKEINLNEVRDRCDRMGGVMDIISRGKNLEIVCKEKEKQFFNYQLFDSAKP